MPEQQPDGPNKDLLAQVFDLLADIDARNREAQEAQHTAERGLEEAIGAYQEAQAYATEIRGKEGSGDSELPTAEDLQARALETVVVTSLLACIYAIKE